MGLRSGAVPPRSARAWRGRPRERSGAVTGWLHVALAAAALAACQSSPATSIGGPPPPTGTPALRAQGNRLVDSAGQPVRLRGVHPSRTAYACAQRWGFFDGPSDSASVQAIASWEATVAPV